MDPTPTFDWGSLLLDKGPLYVVFALIVYGVVRYGPGFYNAHIANLESNRQTNERLATCYETLTESQSLNGNGHVKTHRALSHIVDAHDAAASSPDVKNHLQRAKRELEL
jgi:hypothetical protein